MVGDRGKSIYLVLLGSIVLFALVVQIGFLHAGLLRMTSDESARILIASRLSWSNALEPFVWPPFYKLFVGSALKLYPSLLVTPRVLVCAAGLLSLLFLARLATQLFQDRRISLITALLAVLAPHRLIFSIVPMSDIYSLLFLIAAAAWIAEWIRTDRAQPLFLACASLLLAESVRFESGIFAAFLEALLLYRWIVRRDLGFATLCGASVLMFVFPVMWVLDGYLWYGSLKSLGVTSQQFIGVFGHSTRLAVKWSPLRYFVQDILWNPATLFGLVLLGRLSLRDATIRLWAILFMVPLLALSVFMVVTLSIPMAATWRTSGFWTLIMLPFDAFIMLRVGEFLLRRAHLPRPVLALLLALIILPAGARSVWFAREGMHNYQSHRAHQEQALDAYLDARLRASPDARVVIDSSTNLDFLDVLTLSSYRDRLTMTASGDPLRVALYEPMRTMYAGRPEADGLLDDRFGLARGGSADALARDHIHLVVVRNPVFIAALDGSPVVDRIMQFNDWTVYGVTRTGQADTPRTELTKKSISKS